MIFLAINFRLQNGQETVTPVVLRTCSAFCLAIFSKLDLSNELNVFHLTFKLILPRGEKEDELMEVRE